MSFPNDEALSYIKNVKTINVSNESSAVGWEDSSPVSEQAPVVRLTAEDKHNLLLEICNKSLNETPQLLTKELIDNALRHLYVSKINTYKKKTVSISNLVGCIKNVYYLFQGEKQLFKPEMYPYSTCVTSIGNTIHEILQTCGIKYKKVEDSLEVHLHGFKVTGRCDAILNDNVVCEFKSIEALPDQPKPEHLKQLLIYIHLLNTYVAGKYKIGQLIYFSRGKANVKIFDIEYTQAMDEMVSRFLNGFLIAFDDYLKTGNVPTKYVVKTACDFCGYYHLCHKSRS